MSSCALDTVTMRNTWNDIYEEEEIDKVYQDQNVDRAGDRDHPLNYRDLRCQYLLFRGELLQRLQRTQVLPLKEMVAFEINADIGLLSLHRASQSGWPQHGQPSQLWPYQVRR